MYREGNRKVSLSFFVCVKKEQGQEITRQLYHASTTVMKLQYHRGGTPVSSWWDSSTIVGGTETFSMHL